MTGLLLSGGLDSSILLGHLLSEGRRVQPFYIRTDVVWAKPELAAVREFLNAINDPLVEELQVFDMPLGDLYQNHWSISGVDVPDAQTPDEAVFLPGRNALLAVKPLIWCQAHGIEELALATLAGNPFADATPDFCRRFAEAMAAGAPQPTTISQPFARLHKDAVLALGRHLPLQFTFSCIAPRDGKHCGQCNKCGERQLAFKRAQIADRTRYLKSQIPSTKSQTSPKSEDQNSKREQSVE